MKKMHSKFKIGDTVIVDTSKEPSGNMLAIKKVFTIGFIDYEWFSEPVLREERQGSGVYESSCRYFTKLDKVLL